jgi:hypothetical protein
MNTNQFSEIFEKLLEYLGLCKLPPLLFSFIEKENA